MRRFLLALALIPLITSGTSAAPAPADSWGKAGISFAQYKQDSIDCASAGYYRDISKTEDAKAFVSASKQLDAVTNSASAPMTMGASSTGPNTTNQVDQMVGAASQQQRIVDSIHPAQRMRNIGHLLQSTIEKCLVSKGYSKFVLTDDQRKHLGKLKAGSEQRKAYLYSLASNPDVLEAQAEPAQQ
jgi:hypothetical protein